MIAHGTSIKIFAGNSNQISRGYCQACRDSMGSSNVGTFSDGEIA